jgi:hypothetical protein
VSAGRDPATVDRYLQADAEPVLSLSSVERFRDTLGRAAALGVTDVVTHWPVPRGSTRAARRCSSRLAAEVLPGLTPP